MYFPAPTTPTFVPEQALTTEGFLRYEDIAQDGRLLAIAVPPALGGLWRGVLVRHPGAKAAAKKGVIPILTRLTITAHEQAIRVDRGIEARSGFELAREEDETGTITRLFMNAWSAVHGTSGRIVPHEPPGPLALAGELFAEHTFTRPFAPADRRRVTRLDATGYPEIPSALYTAPSSTSAGEAPAGAHWIDELVMDPTDVVFTLDQTDSNQHVNSIVYVRVFQDAVNRQLAASGQSLKLLTRAFDIAYRKPCFAGDRVRSHVRLFALDDRPGQLGAAGFIAAPDEAAKPRCYVRVLLGP